MVIGLSKTVQQGDEKEGCSSHDIVPGACCFALISSYVENSILQTGELWQEVETDVVEQLKKDELEFVDEKPSR